MTGPFDRKWQPEATETINANKYAGVSAKMKENKQTKTRGNLLIGNWWKLEKEQCTTQSQSFHSQNNNLNEGTGATRTTWKVEKPVKKDKSNQEDDSSRVTNLFPLNLEYSRKHPQLNNFFKFWFLDPKISRLKLVCLAEASRRDHVSFESHGSNPGRNVGRGSCVGRTRRTLSSPW